MSKVIVNQYALRHTAGSKYSHFDGSWEELVDLVEANLHLAKEGHRTFIKKVPVPATRFKTGVVQLTKGCEMVGSFEPRFNGEEPRKMLAAKGVKADAKFVEIICYHSSGLEPHQRDGTDEWEIISVNASLVEDEPIALETLLYNIFGGDGGTTLDLTDAQTIVEIYKSWSYWKDKAMCAG